MEDINITASVLNNHEHYGYKVVRVLKNGYRASAVITDEHRLTYKKDKRTYAPVGKGICLFRNYSTAVDYANVLARSFVVCHDENGKLKRTNMVQLEVWYCEYLPTHAHSAHGVVNGRIYNNLCRYWPIGTTFASRVVPRNLLYKPNPILDWNEEIDK